MKMTKEQKKMYNLFYSAINWDKVKEHDKALEHMFGDVQKQVDDLSVWNTKEDGEAAK